MLAACCCWCGWSAGPLSAQEFKSFDFMARHLDVRPNGLGVPATDRQTWDRLARNGLFNGVRSRAELAVRKDYRMPALDTLYLKVLRSGDFRSYEAEMNARRANLRDLALAECLEYRGRYVFQLEQLLKTFCETQTWILPDGDPKMDNYSRRRYDIDLNATGLAWEMATVVWLHSNRLSSDVQTMVLDNLRRRIFFPFRDMVGGKLAPMAWMTSADRPSLTMGLTGIAGAALADLANRKERASYVASCIDYSHYYISAFPADGYCRDGVVSWAGGFGSYLMLTEMVYENTQGKLNLLKQDRRALAPAMFPDRIRIVGTCYPGFGDTYSRVDLGAFLPGLRDRLLGRASLEWRDVKPDPEQMSLPQVLAAAFLPKPAKLDPALSDPRAQTPRDFFASGGVLICRPGTDYPLCRVRAAMKSGVNFYPGHHNDLGSYVLLLDEVPIVVDPPATQPQLRQSYYHAVPVVDGAMQREGKTVAAATLDSGFDQAQDWWMINLTPAYKVAGLKSLTRTFAYARSGQGALAVTDAGQFARPVAFETAVIVNGTWQPLKADSFLVQQHGLTLRATVTSAVPFALVPEPVPGKSADGTLLRVAVRLKNKVNAPVIKITFTPYRP